MLTYSRYTTERETLRFLIHSCYAPQPYDRTAIYVHPVATSKIGWYKNTVRVLHFPASNNKKYVGKRHST